MEITAGYSSFISVAESGLSFMQMLPCLSNSFALIQFSQLLHSDVFLVTCVFNWCFICCGSLKDFKCFFSFVSDFFCFELQTFLCLIKFSFLSNIFEYLLQGYFFTLVFLMSAYHFMFDNPATNITCPRKRFWL